MKNPLLLFLLVFALSCTQQESESKLIKTAKDFFPRERARVLMVGAFHFDYPGLDAHQIQEENKIDVLKEPKKSEVTELVEYIKRFKPTKIAIEATPRWEATTKLKRYKAGEFRERRDERYQLAMRIAAENNLDTLYAIDGTTMADDLEKLDSAYTAQLWEDFDFKSDDPYEAYYKEWREDDDKNSLEMNLLDYFKVMNSRESHLYGYGSYLIGDFKLDNERGADILSYWWYNRNVRIFRKLQMITESADDRILVVFGNGHVEVLRQLVEASPEFEFVEFDSL